MVVPDNNRRYLDTIKYRHHSGSCSRYFICYYYYNSPGKLLYKYNIQLSTVILIYCRQYSRACFVQPRA